MFFAWSLVACLSRWLDAPYVLATGLQPVSVLAVGTDSLVAYTAKGALKIDGNGVVADFPSAPPAPERATIPLPAAAGPVLARAVDAKGRIYFVRAGEAPALYRVDGSDITLIAEWVGDVTDMTFGGGGLLPIDNLYLARTDGIVEYLRPP